MENKIRALINKMIEYYDLNSSFNLDVVLYKDKAYFTSIALGFNCNECDTKDLAKEIALPIMLMGLSTPNHYENFVGTSRIHSLSEINEWDYDDIEFDLDLAKLWEMIRSSCNNEELRNKIVYISYSCETCVAWYKIMENEEEFDYFIKEYGFDE